MSPELEWTLIIIAALFVILAVLSIVFAFVVQAIPFFIVGIGALLGAVIGELFLGQSILGAVIGGIIAILVATIRWKVQKNEEWIRRDRLKKQQHDRIFGNGPY